MAPSTSCTASSRSAEASRQAPNCPFNRTRVRMPCRTTSISYVALTSMYLACSTSIANPHLPAARQVEDRSSEFQCLKVCLREGRMAAQSRNRRDSLWTVPIIAERRLSHRVERQQWPISGPSAQQSRPAGRRPWEDGRDPLESCPLPPDPLVELCVAVPAPVPSPIRIAPDRYSSRAGSTSYCSATAAAERKIRARHVGRRPHITACTSSTANRMSRGGENRGIVIVWPRRRAGCS